MNEKYILVEHLGNINEVIKKPLQLTQRIKFTCYDVSKNYIVFGATSGGLYVFNRYPYSFIKLIPSKYGSTVQLSISINEKTIALATSKGLIVTIPDCITTNNIDYQVYNEHEGNIVTAMRWSSEELYSGDDKGKISVISLPKLLTKAMFQAPSASLMQLNSPIVQIDCYSHFILISTYSRTYICDTRKEQYRQIGKKLRDGPFGACFYYNHMQTPIPILYYGSSNRSLYQNSKENDELQTNLFDSLQIFCNRPGGRIWEAKLDTTVTCTHQLKDFLKSKQTNIIQVEDDCNSHLKVVDLKPLKSETQGVFNFTKLLVIQNQFILTFNNQGFYIFDPVCIKFITWWSNIHQIKDLRVIENFIYIWDENLEIHVLALYHIEKLILKTLVNKQFYVTSEICITFMEDVLKLIDKSRKIHLLLILKDKLSELQELDLINQLQPLLKAIEDYSDKKVFSQKLSGGIVAVNPFCDTDVLEEKAEKNYMYPETFHTVREISINVTDKVTEGAKNIKEKLQILEATVKNLTLNDRETIYKTNGDLEGFKTEFEENIDSELVVERVITPQVAEPTSELDSNLKIFYQQYEVSKINCNIEVPKFRKLLGSIDLKGVVKLYLIFQEYMIKEKNIKADEMQLWCYKMYLKYVSHLNFEKELGNLDIEDEAFHYIVDAFCVINDSFQFGCKCSFPLPLAKSIVPQYYDVGCAILIKLISCNSSKQIEEIYRRVPPMWRFIISYWKANEDISKLLPLLIQFGDEELIKSFSSKFKYDTWDAAIQYLIKIKFNACINCDNKFKNCDIMSWTSLATLIVQSLGGSSTIGLLMRYADYIPSHELGRKFYLSCIFETSINNSHNDCSEKAIDFTRSIQSNSDASLQFDELMEDFLRRKSVKNLNKKYFYSNGVFDLEKTDLKCSFCDLPLDTPLLDCDSSLNCNHLYHYICLKYNDNICNQCNKLN